MTYFAIMSVKMEAAQLQHLSQSMIDSACTWLGIFVASASTLLGTLRKVF